MALIFHPESVFTPLDSNPRTFSNSCFQVRSLIHSAMRASCVEVLLALMTQSALLRVHRGHVWVHRAACAGPPRIAMLLRAHRGHVRIHRGHVRA